MFSNQDRLPKELGGTHIFNVAHLLMLLLLATPFSFQLTRRLEPRLTRTHEFIFRVWQFFEEADALEDEACKNTKPGW